MGWTLHHAILITTWNGLHRDHAVEKVRDLGLPFAVVQSPVESWWTILVAPDGSKEGWPESDEGDRLRAELKKWVEGWRDPDDRSMSFDWVEVEYGEVGDRTPYGWPMFSRVVDSDDRREKGYDADNPVVI